MGRVTSPKTPVVAIDGPAGSGKSTVARAVSEALGLPALDTGAMYRAVTWAVLDAGVDPADAPAVANLTQGLDLDVGPPVRVGGRDVNDEIRTAEVSGGGVGGGGHPRGPGRSCGRPTGMDRRARRRAWWRAGTSEPSSLPTQC